MLPKLHRVQRTWGMPSFASREMKIVVESSWPEFRGAIGDWQAKDRELGEERKALESIKVELAKEREQRSLEADQAAAALREAKSQMASWQSRCIAAENQARQHGLDLGAMFVPSLLYPS